MFRVAEAANPLHANLLVGILEEHGIRACVQGESLWGIRGEIPLGSASAPTVWVADESHVAEGREIIAASETKPNPANCPNCRCDLHGLVPSQCPQCGASLRREGSWVCPECREVSQTQFTHCWSCGAERGLAEEVLPPTVAADDRPASAGVREDCPRCKNTRRVKSRLIPGFLFGVTGVCALAVFQRLIYVFGS